MKNFIKKIKVIFRVIYVFALATLFASSSCDITPDCERDQTGDMTIKNKTGERAKVDVADIKGGVYDERWVSNNSSTEYSDITANRTKYIHLSFDGIYWVYETEYLSECEHLEFTWTNSGKKSARNLPILIIEVVHSESGVILDVCEIEGMPLE